MQTPTMSIVETVTRQAGMLFIIAPLISVAWLDGVATYYGGLAASWPFMVAAFFWGLLVRRLFNSSVSLESDTKDRAGK